MTIFFTDRNLGKRFGRRLRELGLTVEIHDDHLAQETPDETVIRLVAKRGWVLLTHDGRMRYRPAEKEAILRYGAAVIHLKTSQMWALPSLADHFANHVHRVERFLKKNPPPLFAVYRIGPNGKLKLERKSL